MKKLLKFISMMLILFLVTMNTDSISINAISNDSSSGYKIDITYDENNEADLIGNLENVSDEIILTSLSDEYGNIYDPYKFLLHITENKTYKFELSYKNKEDEKELTENIKVNVNKINKDANSEVKAEVIDSDGKSFVVNDNPVYKLETEIQNDNLSAIVKLDKSSAAEMNTIYSVTDQQGNNYDLESDKWIINENGDYVFDIKYRDNNTGMNLIDKISIKISGLEKRKTMPVEELEELIRLQSSKLERANDNSNKLNLKIYTSESNQYLEKIYQFPGGRFDDFKDVLDKQVKGRTFKEAKILIGGENGSYYKITSLYKYDGNTPEYYYVLENKTDPDAIQLAYQLKDSDEVRLFYEPNASTTHNINNPTNQSWTVKITPGATNVKAGSLVIVEFTYQGTYESMIKVKKSVSGEEVNTEVLNSDLAKRTKVISFTMPESDVYFEYNSNPNNSLKAGVYNKSGTYYNDYEVGYTLIKNDDAANENLSYRIENNNYYFRPTTVSPKIESKQKIAGKYGSNDVEIPVSSYESGKKLTFIYETHRGKNIITGRYDYYILPSFTLDYFPKGINYKDGEYIRTYFEVPSGLDKNNNTIVTTLENGIKITVENIEHGIKPYQYSNFGNPGYANLLKTSVKITVENAYDDFVIFGGSASSLQSNYLVNELKGLKTESTITMKKYGVTVNEEIPIYTGFTFNNNTKPTEGYYTFNLIPEDGYSIPKYKLTDETGKDITKDYKDKQEDGSYEIVENNFPNDKGEFLIRFYTLGFPHEAYKISFISELVQYNYTFNQITETGKNFNVENKRFFSVPANSPTPPQKGQYFNGWKLVITMANGNEYQIENSGKKTKFFYANDLVDILDVYNQSLKHMSGDDVGKNEYELKFEPQFGSLQDGSVVDIEIEIKIQNDPTSYIYLKHTDLKGIYGENFYIGNYPVKVPAKGNEYIINKNTSTFEGVINGSVTPGGDDIRIATLKYDKIIKVSYNANGGSGNIRVDNNEYTVTSGNSSIINVLEQNITMENYKFEGWKIDGDTSGKIYSSGDTIDLSNLGGLHKNIFNKGQIELVAQWKSVYEAIKSDSTSSQTDYEDQTKNQMIFENEEFTIEATFKSENLDSTWTELMKNLKVALYKQENNSSSFTLLANYGGQVSNNINVTWNFEKSGNDKMKVSATINSSNKDSDNNAKYRIIAWNDKNGPFDAQNVNDQVGTAVPSVTTTINVLSNIDIIKYPSKINMFDQPNGDIESPKQMVTVDSQYNSQNWTNEFTVSVENETVEMSGTNGDTFNANIFTSNGTQLTSSNKKLGTLNYSDPNKRSLIFNIKKSNGINNNDDGAIYTGTMKFIVNKEAVKP